MSSNELNIGRPYLMESDDAVKLVADINIGDEKNQMWFSVSKEYGEYLCDDRADVFVASLVPLAFRTGQDIVSEAPVTRRLLYQIRHYLIPCVSKNIKEWHLFNLMADPADTKPECAGAVGLGWGRGVDSMYTLKHTLNAEEPGYRLTHLVIVNNGALETEDDSDTLNWLVEDTRNGIAQETGLKVMGIDSNLRDWYRNILYLSNISYLLPACVMSVQKLFKVFYNSSAYSFDSFSFDANNAAYYELLPIHCYATDTLTFYSAYGSYSRIEKLKELCDYPLAWKYLHSCTREKGDCCGRCGKCLRTEFGLYAFGALDKFSAVYDLDDFRENYDENMARLLLAEKNQHNAEVLHELKKAGIEPSDKAKRWGRIMKAAQTVGRQHAERGEIFI